MTPLSPGRYGGLDTGDWRANDCTGAIMDAKLKRQFALKIKEDLENNDIDELTYTIVKLDAKLAHGMNLQDDGMSLDDLSDYVVGLLVKYGNYIPSNREIKFIDSAITQL